MVLPTLQKLMRTRKLMAFAADPARLLDEANSRWPALEQDLVQ